MNETSTPRYVKHNNIKDTENFKEKINTLSSKLIGQSFEINNSNDKKEETKKTKVGFNQQQKTVDETKDKQNHI